MKKILVTGGTTFVSKYAAKYLHIWFELVINGTKLL